MGQNAKEGMKKHRPFFLFFFAMVGIFFAAAAVFLFAILFRRNIPHAEQYGVPQSPIEERRTVVIGGGRQIPVEVARTADETRRGLSFRESLPEGEGMYFLFPTAEPQTFWMYGMRFPLDIIFIRDDIVINIEPNVPAPKNDVDVPATARSAGQADGVLEINAGKAAEWGIEPGDEITFVGTGDNPSGTR